MLDSIFNFIFFLLVSSSFTTIKEISSPVPILSSTQDLQKDDPLLLTITMDEQKIEIKTGLQSSVIKTFPRIALQPIETSIDWKDFDDQLTSLKKKYPLENAAILLPSDQISYTDLVYLIDHLRGETVATSDTVNTVDQEEKIKTSQKPILFPDIYFGDIQS
jgi:biopolymer transport protein ExbD